MKNYKLIRIPSGMKSRHWLWYGEKEEHQKKKIFENHSKELSIIFHMVIYTSLATGFKVSTFAAF